jgi:hypothetical protein
MRDEELRAELASWVHEVSSLQAPGIGLLRQRARRRTVRRWLSGVIVVAVIAGIGIGVNASLPGTRPLPRTPVASGGHHQKPAMWFPAEKLPAADAAPSVAPYAVDISQLSMPPAVMSTATGNQAAAIVPPQGVTYVGIAGAGDGYTFVLAGTAGSDVRFYEVRLAPDGQPGAPVLLLSIPASTIADPAGGPDTFFYFAISPDASMLAYGTPSAIKVVSLATGKTTTWQIPGGSVTQFSWAGDDRTLAFGWGAQSRTAAARAQDGVRVLDTSASGSLLQASRLVIPLSELNIYGGYPLISADGSKIFATYYGDAGQYGPTTGEVEEYSVRTGQLIAMVTPRIHATGLTGGEPLFCQALWADPSGRQVVSYCNQVGSSGAYLFDGHVRADAGLPTPMSANIDGISFNTTNQILGPWYAW